MNDTAQRNLSDTSPMPFGKYKGVPMANVEASYLLWLFDSMLRSGERLSRWQTQVYAYVNDNMDALKKEVKS
jgi:uncharacterized protein (DUF3820 family)